MAEKLPDKRHSGPVAAPDLDQRVTDHLRDLVDGDSLAVLLGAGASMTVGLPNWETLAVEVLCRSRVINDPVVARDFLAGQDPMLAVEAARAVVDPNDWGDLLRDALYADVTGPPFPSALHTAVAGLAAQRPREQTRLFTLNFDVLLEEALDNALEEVGRKERAFIRAADTPRGDADTFEVHHLHGVITPTPGAAASPVVLGLADFVGLPTRSWQFGELQQALQRGPIILAGTSYRDPDVREWVYELTRSGPQFPVVALLARASMGLTRSQYRDVEEALIKQWNAVGVTPLLLHDHADAAQAIRELPHVSDTGYRPPLLRAQGLWSVLCRDFDHRQVSHSDALIEDLHELQSRLGDDTNVTLWVADGAGSLVRYASPDRRYREEAMLKRVPMGFDSPWIAARCMAIDDVYVDEPARDPDSTRRWKSVVASPIAVEAPGGPPFVAAVLSSATTTPLEDHDVDEWYELLGERANVWSSRLKDVAEDV